MDEFYLPPMERRLQDRYVQLVKAHMHNTSTTAAGPTAVLAKSSAFAARQAAWRFLNNKRVSLPALIQPLEQAARRRAASTCGDCLLVVHDWSKLAFDGHRRSKKDTVQLTHDRDVGYELATALLLSGDDGSPLAPMQFHLRTSKGMLGTDPDLSLEGLAHIDQVGPTMDASRRWGLKQRLVHVVDREADSVAHYRDWDADGHLFLVRGDDRRVLHEGRSMLLSEVADACFGQQERVTDGGAVRHQGRAARQQVVEAAVVLHRRGRRRKDGKRHDVPGRPLPMRLVVCRILDEQGRVLANWYLLTNASQADADALRVAKWYDWRWQVESCFKLLKSHGQQIERWQQERAEAIAKRLLVAAMACVVVWGLQQEDDEQSQQVKDLLVRLSGRQTKRDRPHTAPALLAGLFVLLPMLTLLEQSDGDLAELRNTVKQAIPFLDTG